MVFSNALTVRTEARCRARADLRALPSGREKRAQRANASSRSLFGTMIEDFIACVALAGTARAGSAKRGIFQEMAGDIPPFRPRDWENGSLETKPNTRKARISGPVRRRL
jgi:hypothetical protein